MWVSTICRKYFQNVVANTGHVLNLRYLSKYPNYACKPHEVPLLSNTLSVGDLLERRVQGLLLVLLFGIHHPLLPTPNVWQQILDSSLGKCSFLLILVVQAGLLTSEF